MSAPRVSRIWLHDLIRFYKKEANEHRRSPRMSEFYTNKAKEVENFIKELDDYDEHKLDESRARLNEMANQIKTLERLYFGGSGGC